MKWAARYRARLRAAFRAALAAWNYEKRVPGQDMLVIYLSASKALLNDGNDQVAHLIAGDAYKRALSATRERMGLGPDRQMARTVTFK